MQTTFIYKHLASLVVSYPYNFWLEDYNPQQVETFSLYFEGAILLYKLDEEISGQQN